eukprot:SAG25_NODE_12616_length_277_cov_0.876404_1_plen_36_part_10
MLLTRVQPYGVRTRSKETAEKGAPVEAPRPQTEVKA